MNRRQLLLGATAAVVAPVLPPVVPSGYLIDVPIFPTPTWQQVYDLLATEVAKTFGAECLSSSVTHRYVCALTDSAMNYIA